MSLDCPRTLLRVHTPAFGTDRQFAAVQRFRLQCEVPCWRASVHA
jgi:hypothetical protein